MNSSKQQHPFEIEIFRIILNVFTVTFDQMNASLLNKSVNSFFPFFKKKKNLHYHHIHHKYIKKHESLTLIIRNFS